MKNVYMNRECGIAYTVLAIHTLFHSANKEITLEELINEIRVMFDIYTNEDTLLERTKEILEKEGKSIITVNVNTK